MRVELRVVKACGEGVYVGVDVREIGLVRRVERRFESRDGARLLPENNGFRQYPYPALPYEAASEIAGVIVLSGEFFGGMLRSRQQHEHASADWMYKFPMNRLNVVSAEHDRS